MRVLLSVDREEGVGVGVVFIVWTDLMSKGCWLRAKGCIVLEARERGWWWPFVP